MTPTEVTAILRQFNEWRRGDYEPSEQPAQPDPREIGEAIDAAVEMIDRLEDAESECLEQARLNGMGGEREAALLSKLEAAEKERDSASSAAVGFALQAKKLEAERDALRAKIAEMEKQKPIAWMPGATEHMLARGGSGVVWSCGNRTKADKPLYALPGAETAPSVPECPYPCGWQNLLKHAIEDGAYLARSLNEDEPVTENARVVAMRMVLRLRDVLMAINNAAPEAKP